MRLSINPTLDRAAARKLYARLGRIHLTGFLRRESAAALQDVLANRLPYHLTLNKGDDAVSNVRPEDIDARGPAFREQFMAAIYKRGTAAFQYVYRQFTFDQHLADEGELGDICRTVWEFLNGAEFLTFCADVSGEPGLKSATGQASAYDPGHFLTLHDDNVDNAGRRAAIVLNMSQGWRPDWGGILQFYSPDGHISEGYVPTFNALSMFRVPAAHSVSMVTPMAPVPRLAVSGWVRNI